MNVVVVNEYTSIVRKVLESPLNLATEKELYEQAAAARLNFDESDRDRSGHLSTDEVERLCLLMGLKRTDEDDEFFEKLDANQSGNLDLEEWLEFWLSKVSVSPNPAKQQEVIAAYTFKKFDSDGSNCLDSSELTRVFEQLGADFTADEVKLAIKELDSDGSGLVEVNEFVDWWANRSIKVRSGSSLISLKLKALAKKSLQMFSTDIFKAVWNNDYDLVNAFLKADKRLAISRDQSDYGENWTPLHYASYQGFEEIVKELVAVLDKSQLNCLNGPGFTPLFYACQRGHIEVARILLGAGADPSIWTRVNINEDRADIILGPLDFITDYPELKQLFFDSFHKFQQRPGSLDKALLPTSSNLNSKGCIRFNFGRVYTGLKEGQITKSSSPSLPKELGIVPIKTWHFTLHSPQDISKALLEEDEQSQNRRNKCVFISACVDGKSLCCSSDAPVHVDTAQLTACRGPSFAIAFWLLYPEFSESGVILSSAGSPIVLPGDRLAAYSAWSHFCLRVEKSGHLKLEIADGATKAVKMASGFPFAGITMKSDCPLDLSSWCYVYIVIDTEKQEVSLIVNQKSVGKASFSKEMQDVSKLNELKTRGFVVGSNATIADDNGGGGSSGSGQFALNMRPSSAFVSDVHIYDKSLYPTPTSSVFKRSVPAKSIIDENQTHTIRIEFDWLKTHLHLASSLPDQDIIVAKPIFISATAENKLGLVGTPSAKISVNCQDYINSLNTTLQNMTMALKQSENNEEKDGDLYNTDEFNTLKENFYDLQTTMDNLNSGVDFDLGNTGDSQDLKLALGLGASANTGAGTGTDHALSQLSIHSGGSHRSQGSNRNGGGGAVDARKSLSSHGDDDIHVISGSKMSLLVPSAPSGGRPSSRPQSAATSRTSSSSKLSSLNARDHPPSSGSNRGNKQPPVDHSTDVRVWPPQHQTGEIGGGEGGTARFKKKAGTKLSALNQDPLPNLTAEEQTQYKKLQASQKSTK